MTTTVTITRTKVYPTPGRSYQTAWKWSYSWVADDGSHLVPCQHPAPCGHANRQMNIGSYGPGLSDLRSMLRRKYKGNVKIIESWK